MTKPWLTITVLLSFYIAIHQYLVGLQHIHDILPFESHVSTNADRDNVIAAASLSSSHSRPKILLFITTIFSENHKNHLQCCWPQLLQQSFLLRNADVMIFSNNVTLMDAATIQTTEQLFSNNPSFEWKFPSLEEMGIVHSGSNDNDKLSAPLLFAREEEIVGDAIWLKSNQFQLGANMGMKLGVAKGWFQPFDWMIRINPDVLIRDGRWIYETMLDPSVDAIGIKCTDKPPHKLHTDFMAFRPRQLLPMETTATTTGYVPLAFQTMELHPQSKTMLNHERTAYVALEHLDKANRLRFLPNVEPSNHFCRVRGEHAPVTHSHGSCRNSSMICDALDRWQVH